MKKYLLIIITVLGVTMVYGQTDKKTILFHKKTNAERTYSIALNEYPVYIKPKGGKRFSAIISNYNDSTLTVRTYTKDKTVNEKIMKVYSDVSLSKEEKNNKIDSLRYSIKQEIKLDNIQRIVIYSALKPHRKWIPVVEYIVGISAYAFYVSYQDAVHPNSVHHIPPPVVIVGYGVGVFFLQCRSINLNKWTLSPAQTK